MSTGAGMQGIAILGFGPAALAALFGGSVELAVVIAASGAGLFMLGAAAEREAEAARQAPAPDPPSAAAIEADDERVFTLSWAIEDAWDGEGPDLFDQLHVHVNTRDLQSFTIGAAAPGGFSVQLASLLDRPRFNAWLAEMDNEEEVDWPALMLDDEAGWCPAEDLAERAIAALEAQRDGQPSPPPEGPGSA